MKKRWIAWLSAAASVAAGSAFAAGLSPGNAEAGKQLIFSSCISCHAALGTTHTTDGAPPLSFLAKDNKADPHRVRDRLMDPHPPMPGFMLSRQQIDDVIAYLSTLPTD